MAAYNRRHKDAITMLLVHNLELSHYHLQGELSVQTIKEESLQRLLIIFDCVVCVS